MSTQSFTPEEVALKHGIPLDAVTIDVHNGLVNFNLRDDADVSKYGWISGLTYDLENGEEVSSLYVRHPVVNLSEDQIPLLPDGNITLTDATGSVIRHKPIDSTFSIGQDGPLIRTFKYRGKVYFASAKRLDLSRSTFRGSKPFPEVWKDLGGPDPEDLFDRETVSSPYTFMFILAFPEIQAVSRFPGNGSIFAIGVSRSWTLADTTLKPSEIGNYRVDALKALDRFPSLIQREDLTFEQADAFITNGFAQKPEDLEFAAQLDPRLGPGEFIVWTLLNPETKQVLKTIRIHSVAYAWRDRIFNHNPELYMQFVTYRSYALGKRETPAQFLEYEQMFPVIATRPFQEVKPYFETHGPVMTWPLGQPESIEKAHELVRTTDGAFYNIFLCYLMAMPPSKQAEVLGFYDRFYVDLEELAKWIKRRDEDDAPESNTRIRQIRNEAHVRVSNDIRKQNFTLKQNNRAKRTGAQQATLLSPDELLMEKIRQILAVEKGDSLYRLFRARRQEERALKKQEERSKKFAEEAFDDFEKFGSITITGVGK